MQRANDGDVVGNRSEVRQDLAEFQPTLAVFRELERTACERHLAADKCESSALEQRFRARLAIAFDQLRFWIEEIEVRWRTDHVQVNDALGFWREVRFARRERIGRCVRGLVVHKCRERRSAEAEAASSEKLTTGCRGKQRIHRINLW